MASDVEDGFAAEKDEHDGAEVQNLNSVVVNRTEKEEGAGKEVEVHKEEKKEEEHVKNEVEEEIRMRRHSPRMTLPMQRKQESEKRQDVAGEELRRVSPRFQGGVGKVSKEAEEAKMYLFGLV